MKIDIGTLSFKGSNIQICNLAIEYHQITGGILVMTLETIGRLIWLFLSKICSFFLKICCLHSSNLSNDDEYNRFVNSLHIVDSHCNAVLWRNF